MELIERKVSEFIGLPVVSMEGGIKMGSVKDVLIDTDSMTATALLISGDSGRGGLTFDEVIAIGPDAITVKSSDVIYWASATNPGPGREANEIKGLSVVNVTGDVVGTIHDIALLGDHVKALEVRLGGIFGIGATDTEILAKNIQSIGQKLVTVNVPLPA